MTKPFLDEIRNALKIEKYLRLSNSNTVTKYEQIKDAKRSEMRERRIMPESPRAIPKNASIYANGDKIQSSAKEISVKNK